MSNIAKIIGERVRNYRNKLDLSQEELAGKAELHNTYIGQLERGEKNATLESIEKVAKALELPLETLFEKIIVSEKAVNSNALEAYRLVDALGSEAQESVLKIIKEAIKFKAV